LKSIDRDYWFWRLRVKDYDMDNIDEKLDLIINSQTKISAKQDEMSSRLADVESAVSMLDKTVRGSNGTPGLVSTVNVACVKISRLEDDVKEIKDHHDKDIGGLKVSTSGDIKKTEETVITWRWLVNEFMLPVGLGFLAFVLFQIIPQILEHLGAAN
jgi:hypothetical protein